MLLLKKVDRYVRKFNAILSFAGAIWVLGLMLLIVADVCGRAFFGSPIIGVTDIARNSVVGIACFMLPWTMAMDKHIRSEVLTSRTPEKVTRLLNIFAYMTGLLVFVGILYSGWDLFIIAVVTNAFEGEGALRIVTWPTRLLIVMGAFFSAYHCLTLIMANISKRLDIRDMEVSM